MSANEVIPGWPERDQISVILADMAGELKPAIDLSFLFDQNEVDKVVDIRKAMKIP